MKCLITKTIVVATVFMIVATNSFAQKSFTNSPGDTLTDIIVLGAKKVLDIKQTATGIDTLYLAWKKVSVSLPSQWTASICDNGTCYGTLQDTGSMAAVPSGEHGFLSLHINTMVNQGIAVIRYAVWDVKQPTQIDTVTWIIQAFPTSVNNLSEKSPQVYSSNKILFLKNLSVSAVRTVTVYDMTGKIVLTKNTESDDEKIDMSFCNDGIYIVNLSDVNLTKQIFIGN